jgi:indole-3-glycerol phosphate synthase
VCIGINNRDLGSLRTDISTFSRVRATVPDGILCVAESGVRSPDDVRRLVSEGADAVLIGEALMRADSPIATCAEMVAAGRAAGSS